MLNSNIALAQTSTLQNFNTVVSNSGATEQFDFSLVDSHGIIIHGTPDTSTLNVIKTFYKPLDMKTLFSVKEKENSTTLELIQKQFLHYLEVYGLGQPGLFDLEFDGGQIQKMRIVKIINTEELQETVDALIYRNAPIKDTNSIKLIIDEYKLPYIFDQIKNNELRITLFKASKHKFDNGDDVARFICYMATGQPNLIKSKFVISKIPEIAKKDKIRKVLSRHTNVCAEVFNRHKTIFMTVKNNTDTPVKTIINKISKLSKDKHKPILESIEKTFIAKALRGDVDMSVLSKIGIRDKFKYLNILEYRQLGSEKNIYLIRNGKMWVEDNVEDYSHDELEFVKQQVLKSLKTDLKFLKDKTIILDKDVDYGLPTSRKQSVGNLPFGTKVSINDGDISSGVYWRNEWGASDLDLSSIDISGKRTGWGQLSGFNSSYGVNYSGDITNAYDGAMEFLTSNDKTYGLFLNIFSGQIGAKFELVVGIKSEKQWIKDCKVREKSELNSRGNLIGFVNNKDFIVYQGQLNNSSVSSPRDVAILQRGLAKMWTVKTLLDELSISYILGSTGKLDNSPENISDLKYESFSYDKLEKLFDM